MREQIYLELPNRIGKVLHEVKASGLKIRLDHRDINIKFIDEETFLEKYKDRDDLHYEILFGGE